MCALTVGILLSGATACTSTSPRRSTATQEAGATSPAATAVSTPEPIGTSSAQPKSAQATSGLGTKPARPTVRPDSGSARTAAARYGWTDVVARDDFNGSSLDASWLVYNSVGHEGNGRRSPRQIRVGHGILTMTGTSDGTTAGMQWNHERKYGRWEVRARFPAGCGCYHPVLILWPDDIPYPAGGEVDYAEVFSPERDRVHFALSYDNDDRHLKAAKAVGMTRWRNFAVEWTPGHITAYVDGEPYFHTTQRSAFPPAAMVQTIQLDWFPDGSREGATLEVDWAAIYRL
jgi:hypothetical protein